MHTQNTSSLINFLKKKHHFNDNFSADLVSQFKIEKLDKQTTILHAGERWNKIYFIEQGLLRLYYCTENGKEFNKGFFAENSLVWPIAPSARHSKSLFSIDCVENSRVLWMPFCEFQDQLKQHNIWPSFALPYAENLADQKFLREHQFLVNDAKSRYLHLKQELGDIFERLPDYHIASYMGITAIALSRIKSQIT